MTVPVKNNIDVNSARPVDTAALRVIFRLVSYAPKIHGYRKRAREPAE